MVVPDPESSKEYETFLLSDVNASYATGITLRRNGLMSRKVEYFLTVFDIESGKDHRRLRRNKLQEQLSISSITLQEGNEQVGPKANITTSTTSRASARARVFT
ncbi:MAG: hypothetical protein IPK76_05440 [Lewinellaceae bacterium]|nr:hypothetical protein [Lewinellaceae bacterium]